MLLRGKSLDTCINLLNASTFLGNQDRVRIVIVQNLLSKLAKMSTLKGIKFILEKMVGNKVPSLYQGPGRMVPGGGFEPPWT